MVGAHGCQGSGSGYDGRVAARGSHWAGACIVHAKRAACSQARTRTLARCVLDACAPDEHPVYGLREHVRVVHGARVAQCMGPGRAGRQRLRNFLQRLRRHVRSPAFGAVGSCAGGDSYSCMCCCFCLRKRGGFGLRRGPASAPSCPGSLLLLLLLLLAASC